LHLNSLRICELLLYKYFTNLQDSFFKERSLFSLKLLVKHLKCLEPLRQDQKFPNVPVSLSNPGKFLGHLIGRCDRSFQCHLGKSLENAFIQSGWSPVYQSVFRIEAKNHSNRSTWSSLWSLGENLYLPF
jgi:hypothetical protein